jgi:hypothetical protein
MVQQVLEELVEQHLFLAQMMLAEVLEELLIHTTLEILQLNHLEMVQQQAHQVLAVVQELDLNIVQIVVEQTFLKEDLAEMVQ